MSVRQVFRTMRCSVFSQGTALLQPQALDCSHAQSGISRRMFFSLSSMCVWYPCACSCVVCVWVGTSVWGGVRTCIWRPEVGVENLPPRFFHIINPEDLTQSQNSPVGQISLTNLLLHFQLPRLELQEALHPAGIYTGSRDPDPGPHIGMASVLASEPSPHPFLEIFNMSLEPVLLCHNSALPCQFLCLDGCRVLMDWCGDF